MSKMKLQLSIWAENLVAPTTGTTGRDDSLPDPFCVVTILHKEKDVWPTILDQSEAIFKTVSPDWTKLFPIEYTLGKPLHVCVSIYNNANVKQGGREAPQFMGSAVFEIGTLLGANNGGIMARQVRGGGIVVVHVESRPAIDMGSIHFQLRGLDLLKSSCTNGGRLDHAFFFELQRLRQSIKSGAVAARVVWDVVYRSTPLPSTIMDNNTTWPEAHLDLFALTGGGHSNSTNNTTNGRATKFRLAVYEYENSGNHVFMGDIKLTVDDLVGAVTGVSDHSGDTDKALILKKNGNETGKIVVCMANVETPIINNEHDAMTSLVNKSRALNLSGDEEPDIAVASASETFEADAADMAKIDPTFANYMAGGCEINAIIAIDATSKNGDPRQPTSLHYFREKNAYQQALESLVSILAKYDSDQKYPVYGFGARIDGVVNHCFPFGSTPQHDGVEGVLNIYDQTFKSGIVMSSPRDFSQVIRTASKDAKERLEKGGHAYSVLLLLTSGAPSDMPQTVAALQEADDAPLSIVIVGVGSGGATGTTLSDFGSLPQLEQRHLLTPVNGEKRPRDNVRFVSYDKFGHDIEKLSEAALQQIPNQLVEYFSTRQIYPNPEQEGRDEIAVQPFNDNEEIVVPVQFSQSGQIQVTGDVQPPAGENSSTTNTSQKSKISKAVEFGRKTWNKAKQNKQFGVIKRKATAEIKKRIKQKFPQARFML